MSTAAILNNVNYFIGTVLVEARFSQHWNLKYLHHALHWALYCERLRSTARGKKYEQQLNELMNELCDAASEKDGKAAVQFSGLSLLENASLMLREALLQNHHLPGDVLEELLSNGDRQMTHDIVLRTATIGQQLTAIVDAVDWDDEVVGNESAGLHNCSIKQQLQASLIHRKIISQTSATMSKSEISEIIEKAIDDRISLPIILLVLIKSSGNEIIQDLIVDKIVKDIEINRWRNEIDILVEAAASCHTFLSHYVKFLVDEARSLVAEYTRQGVEWVQGVQNDGSRFSFEDVVVHFKKLVYDSGSAVSSVARSELLARRQDADGLVFDDVIAAIKH